MYLDAAVLQDSRNNTPVTQRFVRTKAGQAYTLSLSVQLNKFYKPSTCSCILHFLQECRHIDILK